MRLFIALTTFCWHLFHQGIQSQKLHISVQKNKLSRVIGFMCERRSAERYSVQLNPCSTSAPQAGIENKPLATLLKMGLDNLFFRYCGTHTCDPHSTVYDKYMIHLFQFLIFSQLPAWEWCWWNQSWDSYKRLVVLRNLFIQRRGAENFQ